MTGPIFIRWSSAALDVEGRPICCEMRPGNTADVKTHIPILKRMKECFRLREIRVVADGGITPPRPFKMSEVVSKKTKSTSVNKSRQSRPKTNNFFIIDTTF
jgi:hypothetical protein